MFLIYSTDMKRILIWDYSLTLSNSGGPAGYLYNIKQTLPLIKNCNIAFLSDIVRPSFVQSTTAIKPRKTQIIKWLRDWLRPIYLWYGNLNPAELQRIDFNQFDIVHFHSSVSLSLYGRILKSYKGKIILTSHSPQPLSDEYIEARYKSRLIQNVLRPVVRRRELKAWKRADYLMFPVEEAVEVYFAYSKMKQYFEDNHHKFIYCPSSISKEVLNNVEIDIRKANKIPNNGFILCFIGRHNEIKGYDQLKKIGSLLLKKYENIYIVIAGKETPLKRYNHERWIELGWINYGNELIQQSDVFILPNKATYFDLVALEVLREGTPMIITRTGGNKYFEKLNPKDTEGIIFYDYGSYEQVEKAIMSLVNSTNKQRNYLRKKNIELFNSRYTTEVFLERYVKLMNDI